jgi:hypothetical protein
MVENADGILSHKEPWLEIRNNSERFAPHPSFVICTLLLSCVAHRLAWHACTYQIDCPISLVTGRKRANVAPSRDVRPMLCEHPASVVINLDLPPALHASTLKAKIKAANASE